MGSRQLSSRFTGIRWIILLNRLQTIVQQIHRESPGYSPQRVLDYCSVDSLGVAGLFFATGQRLLSSRYSQGVAGYSSKRFLDYCPVEIHRESLGFFLNGFSTIVEQIHREPLGYSSQWVQDNCPVDSQGVDGLFFSTDSRLLSSRYSQGVAGLFFSTGSRLLSSRFTGSRRVILLSGFQAIVQQIHWESLGYSSQRVLDYCPVDSQGVPGLFFSMGSRLLSSRFAGSLWVILPNGFSSIVQQIHRKSLGYSSQRFPDYCPVDIHRESLCYSSQRVLDYCPVDSQGVAGLFFSTGSRLLSSRFTGSRWFILLNGFQTIAQQLFTGSRWVILLNGFQTIVKQIHRESLVYSSQRVPDYRPVVIHRESLGYSSQRVPDYCTVDSQGVAGLFFSTGSRLLSSRFTGSPWVILLGGFKNIVSRFTGSRWVILLNGFQSIVQQIHRKSLGYSSQRVPDYCPVDIHRESLCYSSQRVLDYCPVDSQGVAGLFFSTGSRLLSSRFTGSRWVILLNGFKTIVQKIHRESMGYSSQRILDYCPVDIHRESLGYSSQRVLDYCPVDSQGVAGLFFSAGSRLLFSRFTGSRWVILLKGFQTIVQQIHRESLGYSSRWVQDYCPVDSQGVSGLFFSTGSRQLSSRFTGSRWVILPNGFQTIVQQIFTGSRCVILLNGFQTIVKQIHRESLVYSSQRVPDYRPVVIHRESLGYSSQRVPDYCTVDSQGVAGLFFSTGSRLLSSRFTGSPWVILLGGFKNIVQQIHRESLGYSSQRVLVNCPVDSQEVAGLFFPTGSRLLSSRYSQGVAVLFFSTGSRLLSSRFTGSHWVILLNGFQTIVQKIFTGSRWVILLNGLQIIVHQISTVSCWVILLNWFQTIVKQIHRESLGYSSQRFLDYCPVEIHRESLGYSSQQVLDYCPLDIHRESLGYSSQRFLDYCPVEIHRESLGYYSQQVLDYCPVDIHRESLGYSSQRVQDYCSVDSLGVAGLFFSKGSRLLSSRFTGSPWVILLDGFKTIVQQIQRKSLGYSSQRVPDYRPVVIHRESLGYSSQRVLDYCQVDSQGVAVYSSQLVPDYCTVDSQGVAGLFFSTGSRVLSSRFTGSPWVILLGGFKNIVQQIHRESLGYSSQLVLVNCPVDSQEVAGLFFPTGSRLLSSGYSQGVAVLFFSTGSRLLSSRFTGSRWVILLNGFQTIVKQIHRESLVYSSQRVPDYRPVVIHRESLGYSSQRVPDYCTVDSQGVAGLFFSTGSRLLSSRFTGSPWVILLGGFKNIVQQIHRESLGYSSQRVLVNCPVDSQEVAGLFFPTGSRLLSSRYSQGVAVLFFSTGSRLLSSRFTGSRWVIFLNGFQTIVKQIHRESLVYSSQRVLDYCPVVIHRESLGYSSQRVLDYCQVDSQGVAVYSSQRFLDYCQVEIHRASLGYFSQRVLDYCPVDIHRESLGYSSQRVVDYCPLDIHSELLGYSSQLVLDYCQVDSQGVAGLFFSTVSRLLSSRDSQGVAGLFFSTGSRLLSTRYSQGVAGLFFSMGSRQLSSLFTGSRWVILLNGFQTIVQQIFTGSRWLFFSAVSRLLSSRDSQGVVGFFFLTGSRLLPSRFTGSRWVTFLNGFKTIVQQIHRDSLDYSSQQIVDYCPVDSQGVAGLFSSAGSRLLFSRFTGSRWVILRNRLETIVQQIFTGSRWLFF